VVGGWVARARREKCLHQPAISVAVSAVLLLDDKVTISRDERASSLL